MNDARYVRVRLSLRLEGGAEQRHEVRIDRRLIGDGRFDVTRDECVAALEAMLALARAAAGG